MNSRERIRVTLNHQAGVPVENLLALYEAVNEFR